MPTALVTYGDIEAELDAISVELEAIRKDPEESVLDEIAQRQQRVRDALAAGKIHA